MEGCLFCGIVARKVPADVVYETERTLAFRDIHPKAPTHVLVVPRQHAENVAALSAADPEVLAEVFASAVAVARAQGLETGYRLVANTGPDAGQEVEHLHVHVLGGRRMSWPPG